MGRKSPPGRGLSRRLRPDGLLAHCPQRSRPRSVARGRPGQRPSGLQMSQPPPRALPPRALPPRALPPRALPARAPRGATRKEEKEARPAQTDEQGRERERERERERSGERGRESGRQQENNIRRRTEMYRGGQRKKEGRAGRGQSRRGLLRTTTTRVVSNAAAQPPPPPPEIHFHLGNQRSSSY